METAENRRTAPPLRQVGDIVHMKCPNCGQEIVHQLGYVPWCRACEWGLEGDRSDSPYFVDRLWISLGKRFGANLLADMKRANPTEFRSGHALLILTALATVTYAVTLAMPAAYLALAAWLWPHWWFFVPIPFAIMSLWWFLPRFPKDDFHPISRTQYPTLYRVVEEIASIIGANKITALTLNTDLNAYIAPSLRSFQQRINLGLSLVALLDSEEFVALLGHEIGHSVTGNLGRGIYIWYAFNILTKWSEILVPIRMLYARNTATDGRLGAGAGVLANIGTLLFGSILRAILTLYSSLLWRDRQRGEFLADDIAAQLAGSEKARSMLVKLHYRGVVGYSKSRIQTGLSSNSLFDEVQVQLNEVPEGEKERIERTIQKDESRVDASHPPTNQRLELVESRRREPTYTLSQEDFDNIRRELAAAMQGASIELLAARAGA